MKRRALRLVGGIAPDGKSVPASAAPGTATMERRDGRWMLRAFENVIVDPVAAQHDLSK